MAVAAQELRKGERRAVRGWGAMRALTDAEGFWSTDIEQSFQEATATYLPCGQRKILLNGGKLCGCDKLISCDIKLRTWKT